MRIRTLAPSVALLVALAGCTAEVETASGETEGQASSTASSPAEDAGGDTGDAAATPGGDPVFATDSPQPVEAVARMPFQFDGAALLPTGWTLPARQSSGMLLGGAQSEDALTYTALGTDGTALWTVGRPAWSTQFALTGVDSDLTVAVLLDGASSAEATASGFDAFSGERLWGPVEVPGPFAGEGLVFGEDDGAASLALDPATGEAWELDEGEAPLATAGATLISLVGEGVVARTADGEAWRLPLSDAGLSGEVTARRDLPGLEGHVVLTSPDQAGALIDVASGAVVAQDVSGAVTDGVSGATVYLTPGELRGAMPAGEEWTAYVGAESVLVSVGGAIAYLVDGSALSTRNAVTGAPATGYPEDGAGDVALPLLFTPAGAAVLRIDGERYLAVPPGS